MKIAVQDKKVLKKKPLKAVKTNWNHHGKKKVFPRAVSALDSKLVVAGISSAQGNSIDQGYVTALVSSNYQDDCDGDVEDFLDGDFDICQ